MRIRRAATLACTFEASGAVVHNFLDRRLFECKPEALGLLAKLEDWTSIEDALNIPDHGTPGFRADMLREFLRGGLVVVEGSPEDARDQRYRATWRWGSVAGFYHFGLRDSEFLDATGTAEQLRRYGGPDTSPSLLLGNEGLDPVIPLPPFDRSDAFNDTLYRRRSHRKFSGRAIPLGALANCLFAGNGFQEMLEGGEFGRLPLTMTPSGGARNPFELYVYARAIKGLDPGFYHYSAREHSLGFLHADALPPLPELLGGQQWTANAAAVVFLCANFERPAWKYRQALAYRVVLMEVGAIVQNMQLEATHIGISSAPTGALAESRVEELLGLEDLTQAALFALVLGDPD